MVDQLYNSIVIRDLKAKIAELENYQLQAQDDLTRMSAHIEQLREAKPCRCGDVGFFVVANNHTGDPEQEQCEFCYTEPCSRFNILNETPKQSLTHIKQDAIREFIDYVENDDVANKSIIPLLRILADNLEKSDDKN